MQVPSVTEVHGETRGDSATRVGWRLTTGGVEPLEQDAMLLDEASDVPATTAWAALVLWLRDPEAHGWDVRGSDEIGGLATALDLADGAGAQCAFAVGPVHSFADTAGRAARLWIGGEQRGAGDLLADYADTLRAAQRRLEEQGERLRPGEFLLVGVSEPVPVSPRDRVRVEIDGLEELAVEIAA
jgi:hypothetical protein